MREGLSRLSPVLVLIAFCVPLFIGLGSTDLGNDEAIYSYAVESIITTGEWLAPRSSPSADEIFLEKPYLKLWIVAAPIRLGLLPLTEFGLRFWDALFGAASFLYVFLIGRHVAGWVCGLVAAIVLFAHAPVIFEHGFRSNNMDAAIVVAYCGGIYHYLRWTAAPAGRSRAVHIAAVAAFFHLGFMSKFVAAIFLPGVIGVCALLVPQHRDRLIEDRRRWAIATVATIAAVVPWFAYQHLRHGMAFWDIILGAHVVTRFTTFVDPSHVQPWHFYFTEGYRQFVRSGSAIWVGFGLLVLAVDAIRRRSADAWVVLAWAFLPALAISLGSSKLYHYFYPFVPPLALAAGYGVAVLARTGRRLVPLTKRLDGFHAAIPTAMRIGATAIIVAAVAVIVATAITGTFSFQIGDVTLFRNTSLLRPAILIILCVAAIDLRTAIGAALVLALSSSVPMPFAAVRENLWQLRANRQPLHLLAGCIREIDESRARLGLPSGTYAPVSDAFLHQYFFYLRGTGWLSNRIDEGAVRKALFEDGHERALVLDTPAYADFLQREGAPEALPAAIDYLKIVVLLPGPYSKCLATQAPVPR